MEKRTVRVEVEFPKQFVDAVEKLVSEKGYWCRGLPEFVEEAVRLHYRLYELTEVPEEIREFVREELEWIASELCKKHGYTPAQARRLIREMLR